MAKLIPKFNELEILPQSLTDGESALVDALMKSLNDEWTIYVQPFMNGICPDVIVFSEDYGFGIFEVKDWDLSIYKIPSIPSSPLWSVFDNNHRSHKPVISPFEQLSKYRWALINNQLPELGARSVLDTTTYHLFRNFVNFHNHSTQEVEKHIGQARKTYELVFGRDKLPDLRSYFKYVGLTTKKHPRLLQWVRENHLSKRVQTILANPEQGKMGLKHLLREPGKEQRKLILNTPGENQRVLGAAGSGKTFILVRKAVDAALAGQSVLVVCFNITMQHYLQDMIRALAAHYGPHIHRNIQIYHYHGIFMLHTNEDRRTDPEKIPIDVLLIDEGQDFKIDWIKNLVTLCKPSFHLAFFEDDRQDIYGQARLRTKSLPFLPDKPIRLRRSYRIKRDTAKVANRLVEWFRTPNEIGEIVIDDEVLQTQKQLMYTVTWFNGTNEQVLHALRKDLKQISEGRHGYIADTAILVCNVESGWDVCRSLEIYGVPYQTNFESEDKHEQLLNAYPLDMQVFDLAIERLRRFKKAAFWLQGGKLKVCTIHSFKGWELSNVMVYFDPKEQQLADASYLLYTAMTRSMDQLTIYNTDSTFARFGNTIINEQLAGKWTLPM